ncbi:MAG TPA: cysteine desulfurase family protein [Phycisphaerae bacterium]|nr:cysteine desulfurase family protein [Phycisphaerae bacterium]
MPGTARIYFDNAATTPLDPRVRAAMQPYLDSAFGNPSSLHCEGRAAKEAVEEARGYTAALVGAKPSEVVFTSGGTEADSLAIRGVVRAYRGRSVHVITSAIEHPAVREACRDLAIDGIGGTLLRVSANGIVDPDELSRTIRPDTRLISIMAANNVVGTLQPVQEFARIARDHGVLFHTDAVQAAGKVPLDVHRDGIDLLSVSGHKLHGPKGAGALVVRDGVPLAPLILGGGQEAGRRPGTENVAAIVGLGEAARIYGELGSEENARLVRLRERLIEGALARGPDAYLIGDRHRRLPGHVCLGFAGLEGEAIKLLLALDELGVSVSSGSACGANHAGEPSHVLTAMGFDSLRARGAVRITLGRFNTEDEVDHFLRVLPGVVGRLNPITRRARAEAGACA